MVIWQASRLEEMEEPQFELPKERILDVYQVITVFVGNRINLNYRTQTTLYV